VRPDVDKRQSSRRAPAEGGRQIPTSLATFYPPDPHDHTMLNL
jgi:hypothetical protein